MTHPEKDPFELEWFEVRALMKLNEQRNFIFLRDFTDQIPADIRGATICSLTDMARPETRLVQIITPEGQPEELIRITRKGRAVLFEIMNSYQDRYAVD